MLIMSSNQIAGSFQALRGETCNFTNVAGIKSLLTLDNVDLVTIGNRIEKVLDDNERQITDLMERLEKLEKEGMGKPGRDGEDGRDGAQGPVGKGVPGPRGPRGKVEKMQDIGDVNLDGLDEGAVLTWSVAEKSWVVSME